MMPVRALLGAGSAATMLAAMFGVQMVRPRSAPPRCAAGLPGLTVDAAGGGRSDGLVVTSLRDGGAAALAGIRVGDALVAVDGRAAASPAALAAYLARDSSSIVSLRVAGGYGSRTIRLERGCGGRHGAEDPGGRG